MGHLGSNPRGGHLPVLAQDPPINMAPAPIGQLPGTLAQPSAPSATPSPGPVPPAPVKIADTLTANQLAAMRDMNSKYTEDHGMPPSDIVKDAHNLYVQANPTALPDQAVSTLLANPTVKQKLDSTVGPDDSNSVGAFHNALQSIHKDINDNGYNSDLGNAKFLINDTLRSASPQYDKASQLFDQGHALNYVDDKLGLSDVPAVKWYDRLNKNPDKRASIYSDFRDAGGDVSVIRNIEDAAACLQGVKLPEAQDPSNSQQLLHLAVDPNWVTKLENAAKSGQTATFIQNSLKFAKPSIYGGISNVAGDSNGG